VALVGCTNAFLPSKALRTIREPKSPGATSGFGDRPVPTTAELALLIADLTESLDKNSKDMAAYQKIMTESVDKTSKTLKDFISSQAKEREVDVTWATEAGLLLEGFKPVDLFGKISTKIYNRHGEVILEWDGLIFCPETRSIFCVEAKTTVRRTQIDKMPSRLEAMAEWMKDIGAWVREGKPLCHKEYLKQAEGLTKIVNGGDASIGSTRVVGVIGPISSATGVLAKRAKERGLYIVLRKIGELVAPENI